MNLNKFLAFALIFLWIPRVSTFARGREIHFVILHTNDLHGHLLPYMVKKRGKERLVGGFDRLSAMVEKIRGQSPVLLLDAGDISQGTPISNLFFGSPMAESMNLLHYDAAVVGNHEFDWGIGHLRKFIHGCRFPILAANVEVKTSSGTLREIPGTKPDLLLTVDGVKIGIVGVVTPEAPEITKAGNTVNLVFLPPAPVVKKYAEELKEHGADLIIALTHLGVDDDKLLAAEDPEINLIVGGHSHTALKTPIQVGRVEIVQAGSYCAYLGRTDVTMRADGSWKFDDELLPVRPGGKRDPKVSAVIAEYEKKEGGVIHRQVAELKTDLTRNSEGESTMGDAVTDAIRWKTGVDVAFENSGGLRSDLFRGRVDYGEVYTVLPFDDEIVEMDLTGAQILQILQTGARGKHGLIQVSGARYGISGGKVVSAEVGGKTILMNKIYRAACNDFLSTGGDDFFTFKQGKNKKADGDLRLFFTQYLETHSPFSIHLDGRIGGS